MKNKLLSVFFFSVVLFLMGAAYTATIVYAYTPVSITVLPSTVNVDYNSITPAWYTMFNVTTTGGSGSYRFSERVTTPLPADGGPCMLVTNSGPAYSFGSAPIYTGNYFPGCIIFNPGGSPYSYNFTAADSSNTANNSSALADVYIHQALTAPTISFSRNPIDNGLNSTLDTTWSGGTPGYTLVIYSGSSAICSSDTNIVNTYVLNRTSQTTTLSPPSNTYYCAKVTDSQYLSPVNALSGSALLIVNPLPLVAITAPASPVTIDEGQNLTISASATHGTPPYTYSWSVHSGSSCPGFSNPGNVSSFTYHSSGASSDCRFSVSVTDSVGGTDTGTTPMITVNHHPTVSISPTSNTFDLNQLLLAPNNITWTGTPSYGTPPYTVNFILAGTPFRGCLSIIANSTCTVGEQESNLASFPGVGSNTIKVVATDSVGVQASATAAINIKHTLNIPFSVTNAIVDSGQATSLQTTVSGGTGSYNVTFYNTSTNANLCGIFSGGPRTYRCVQRPRALTPTTYSYNTVVTDTGTTPPFTISNTIYVKVFPALVVSITNQTSTLDAGQQITFVASGSGGTGNSNYTYTWNVQAGLNIVSGCASGPSNTTCKVNAPTSSPSPYHVTVTLTDRGTTTPATASQTANLTVNPTPTLALTPNGFVTVDGGQAFTFNVIVSGGTGAFTAMLYNITGMHQQGSNVIIPLPGGSNTLTIQLAAAQKTYYFNAVATDKGTTVPFTFNSVESILSINPAPGITLEPSNTYLDTSQKETFAINITGGFGPFNTELYNMTGRTQTGSNITITRGILGFISFIANVTGTLSFNAIATDTGTLPPHTFNSIANTIIVRIAPTLTINPSNTVLDVGQTETYTFAVTNGFGPFTAMLYNITGMHQQGSNVTITSTPGNNSISFIAGATGLFTYNGIATDLGASTPYVFDSASNTILVDSLLLAPNLSINDTVFDEGQTVVLSSTQGSGGTAPYTYNFIVKNALTDGTIRYSGFQSSNTYSFTSNAAVLGSDYAYVVVKDSASVNAINESAHKSFSVYPTPSATLTPSREVLDSGQTETYTISVINGEGPFDVELYNITGSRQEGSNVIIPRPGSSNTVSFITGNTGTFSYKAIITDTGPNNTYTFATSTNTIKVNTALTPPPTPGISNSTLDQGQTENVTSTIPITGTPPYYYEWLISYDNMPYVTNSTLFDGYPLMCSDPALFSNNHTARNLIQQDPTALGGNTVRCIFATSNSTPQGTYSFKLQVSDSASTPETLNSTPSNAATLNTNTSLGLFASNTVLDSGQTETFSLIANGGFGPFTAMLYNITGMHQQGSTVLINTPAGSNSLSFAYTSNTTSMLLPPGAASYIFGAADGDVLLDSFSWASTINAPKGNCYPGIPGAPCGSIGYQSSNIGSITTNGLDEGVIAGIGIDAPVSAANVFSANSVISSPYTFTYNVTSRNATVFIVAVSGWYASFTTLPPGCSMILNTSSIETYSGVTIAECRQHPGAYSLTLTPINTPSSIAVAAYVFPGVVSLYPAGSNTVSFTTSATGSFSYNAEATDLGTTTPDLFGSPNVNIKINTALLPTNISINGSRFDTGQSITLRSSVPTTGTSPYVYNFIVYNSLTDSILLASGYHSSNAFAFNANSAILGGDKANVIVGDNATTPEYAVSLNTVMFSVKIAPIAKLYLSNTILDSGQVETLTANVINGFGPFTYTFYNVSANSAMSGCISISTPSCTFTTNAVGTYTYNAVVTDTGTPTPYITSSNPNTITVNTDPVLTITPSSDPIEAGDTETYTLHITGGTDPFTAELYNITGKRQQGSNVTVTSTPGSNTVSFTASGSSLQFNGIATDLGTTTPYVFNSAVSDLEISSAPNITLIPSNTVLDAGQYETYSMHTTNGIGPFNIELYNITGMHQQGTANNIVSGNTAHISFTTGAAGIFTFNAIATDTGTIPPSLFSSAPNTIVVYTHPNVTLFSSNQLIDEGQYETLTANVNGGSGNFLYTFYNITNFPVPLPGCSNITKNTCTYWDTYNNYVTYGFNVIVKDQNTTTPYVFNSPTNTVAYHPALVVAVPSSPLSNKTLDVGQNITIAATPATHGTSPYIYSWSVHSGSSCPGFSNPGSVLSFTYTPSSSTGNCIFVIKTRDSATTPESGNLPTPLIIVNSNPAVTISPTNTILDEGQISTFTAGISGGTGPFAYQWYLDNNAVGTNSSTFIFNANTSTHAASPDSVNVVVTDEGTSPPYSFNSVRDMLTVNTAPYVASFTPLNKTDVGQTEIYGLVLSGGTGTFTANLIFVQGSSIVATNAFIPVGGTADMTFVTLNAGAPKYTANVVDTGTTYPYTFNSPISTLYVGNPAITSLSATNTLMDVGQISRLNTSIFSSGWGPFTANFVYTNNGMTAGSVAALPAYGWTANFIFNPSSAGTYSFNSMAVDEGTTVPYVISSFPAIANVVIKVGAAPSVAITPSSSSIHADQAEMLSNVTTGGTPPYTYQWFIKAPNSSTYNAIPGATSNAFTFNVIAMHFLRGGTYNFILQAKDSATMPFIFNSLAASVSVNAMFANPKLLLWVHSSITNDSDSGNHGNWALDAITRTIRAWKIGLMSFHMSFNDLGAASTYVGVASPGAGVLEPYNGIAPFTGFDQIFFNGTFSPGSNTVSTSNISIGTFNDQGSLSGNIITPSLSTFDHFIGSYFAVSGGTSNFSLPVWSDIYKYSIYPPQGQTWLDAYNGIAGDIITYKVPYAVLSVPSNVVLDHGQSETYSASIYNGIGPFTANLFISGNSVPQQSLTVPQNGLGNVGSASADFAPFIPPVGRDTYYVIVSDNGANYTFNSTMNTIIVNPAPNLTISPSNAILDAAQTETYTLNITNGTGAFTAMLYNITGMHQQGSNVIIQHPGGSNTISFVVNAIGSFQFNGIATDLGTTTPYIFNSVPNTIIVNPALKGSNVSISGNYFDAGETVALDSTLPSGGTPPYKYTFVATKDPSNTFYVCIDLSFGVCPFTATQTGTYFANVIVSDSASTPQSVNSVNPANFIVNHNFELYSSASATINRSMLDIGNSILITASIVGPGGTSPYTYTFDVENALSSNTVDTVITTSAATSNSIIYTPPNNGMYYATVTVTDSATPSELITSPHSEVFLVGAAGHPSLFATPTSLSLDSGQIEVFNIQAFGGVGPFTIELYNETGNRQQCGIAQLIPCNVIINSPGHSNTVSFDVPAVVNATSFTYNAIATDISTSEVFNSSSSTIIVHPPLADDITLSANSLDIGQHVLITENVNGGTPPYHYNFIVYNSIGSELYSSPTENSMYTTNSFDYTPLATGLFSTNVIVYDNSTSAPEVTNSITESFTVYTDPLIKVNVTMQNVVSGQGITIASNTLNPGSGGDIYQWYNASTNTMIAGQRGATYTATAGATGIFGYYVIVTDSNNGKGISGIATLNVSAAAVLPSGGSPGGGSGGGGGGGKPTVVKAGSCYNITNFMVPNYENLTFSKASYFIRLNFISPTDVGVTVDNTTSYTLYPNASTSFAVSDGYNYTMDVTGMKYVGLIDSISLEACGKPLAVNATTVNITNSSVNSTINRGINARNSTLKNVTLTVENTSLNQGATDFITATVSNNESVSILVNNITETSGMGSATFNANALGQGTYAVEACSGTTCSAVTNLTVSTLQPNKAEPISNATYKAKTQPSAASLIPLLIGIAIVIAIAVAYYSKNGRNGKRNGKNVTKRR